MELRHVLAALRRRAVVAAVVFVAALLVAPLLMRQLPKEYTSETDLFVTLKGDRTADQLLSGSTFAQQRAKTYAEAVKSPLILAPAAQSTGYPGGAEALEKHTSVDIALDSVILRIGVKDTDPGQAARAAEAIGNQLVAQLPQMEGTANPQVSLTTIRPATTPTEPTSPSARLVYGACALAGLVLAVLVALLVDAAARRRHSKNARHEAPDRVAA